MSNEQIRLAREWAKEADSAFLTDRAIAARDYILATTPEPTMADVEWDWDKHMLAGATLAVDGATFEATMLTFEDGFISYVTQSGERGMAFPERLTPNGTKYELREVTDGEHPETLTTVEDYENAPLGTVVDIFGTVAIRQKYGWAVTGYRYKLNNDEMLQQGKGVVVRWGE